MAVVREELRLVDYFSGPLISYAQGVRTARQGTAALQTAAQQLTAAQRAGTAAAQAGTRVQGQLAGVQRQQAAAARVGANAGQQAANAGRSAAGAAQQQLGATRSNTAALQANTAIIQANTAAAGQQTAAVQANTTAAGANTVTLGANTTATGANTAAIIAQTVAIHSQTDALRAISSALAQHNRMQTQARIAAEIATAEMRRQQGQMNSSRASADGLASSLRRLAGTYLSFRGIVGIGRLSDEVASSQARLSLMNDGLQTTEKLQEMIYQAANRAGGSYLDMTATVSKLGILAGQAFDSTKELVAFTELLNKNFVVGGAAAQEQSAAMYQLTQAMASGRLQGDEYRSIIENAPLLAQSIEDYMRNVQKAEGSMKDWASQGLLTSEVIKAAMFNSADEVEARYASMPKTWGQTWQLAQNIAIKTFQPLLQIVGAAAGFVSEHIEAFIGAFYGLAAAVTGYYIAQGIATIAAKGFIATLMESPLLPIAALFMVIGAAVGVLISYLGGAREAVGALAGAIAVAGAFIWNTVIGFISAVIQALWSLFVTPIAGIIDWVVNIFTGGFDNIIDIGKNALGQLLSTLLSFAKTATGIIDTIFGTHTTDKLTEWQNELNSWGKNEKSIDLHIRDMDPANYIAKYRIEYGQAWDAGNVFGAGLAEKWGIGAAGAEAFDYNQFGGEAFGESIADDTSNIAADTKAIKNAVDMSDETLKMLVDMAERRYVNNINLTAQSPVIQVQGQNTGDTMADRYKLADALRDVLLEQASAGATRSTAMAF